MTLLQYFGQTLGYNKHNILVRHKILLQAQYFSETQWRYDHNILVRDYGTINIIFQSDTMKL